MSKQSLEGTRMNAFKMDPEDVVVIGLDTEHKRGEHPLWMPSVLSEVPEEMVLSMMKFGNIQAITIRKNGDKAEVVAGRKRVRAAREANKRLVEAGKEPIRIKVLAERAQDVTVLGIAISENAIRFDDSTMHKARLLETLLALGATDTEASIAFGVSTTAIRQWKALLDLHPDIQDAVDSNEISASAAAEFAPLEREEQLKQFNDAMEKAKASGGKVTTKQTRQRRQKATNDPNATPYTPPRKPIVRSLIETATADNAQTPLSADAIAVLQWTLGLCEASAVPGLEDALKAVETAKEEVKASKGPKLTKPQKALMDLLGESEQLATNLNSKTLKALIDRGLAEIKEGEDGLEYAHKVEAVEHTVVASSGSNENEVAA